MFRRSLWLGLLALGCSSSRPSQSPRACVNSAAAKQYFAESPMIVSPSCKEYFLEPKPGTDCARTIRDLFESRYSPLLALMAERPLVPRRDGWVLRIMALPSFDRSWLVRIEVRGEQARMTIKYGACPHRSIERPLTLAERRNLLAHLNAADLFSELTLSDWSGLDGTTYLVELADPRGHRVLNRWSPTGNVGRLVSYVAMLD